MSDRPEITEAHVRRWIDARSFERGQGYFRAGRIRNPRRQGDTLKAACEGSMPHPYHVKARLGAAGIASADCSCPVGDGGHCKHVAALLLTWVDGPGAFSDTQTLQAKLGERSKEDLIRLIAEMVDRHPDLEALVELPVARAAGAAWEAVEPEVIRRQVRHALLHSGDDWQASARAAADLDRLVALGDDYAAQDDWKNAITVYGTLGDEVRECYDEVYDHDGDVIGVLYTCSEQLGALLDTVENDGGRQAILQALFDLLAWDVHLGGYGISDAVPPLLMEETTPEERARVAGWTRAAMERASSDWARRAFGGLLLDLEADTLGDDAYLQLCRDAGLLEDLVGRLLALGRLDDALAEARRAGDYALLRLTDLFADHGHAEAVAALVKERQAAGTDTRLTAWLRDYAQEQGNPGTALDLSQQLFWERPSVPAYGSWGRAPLRIEVARAAEEEYPDRAANLYLDTACTLIEQRGRGNYAQAAEYLGRIRAVYGRAGNAAAWASVIDALREDNRNLPAFQDELDKAGL